MLEPGETSEPPVERTPERRVVAAVLAVVASVAIAAPYLPGHTGVITVGGAGIHAAGKAVASGAAGVKSRLATNKPIAPTPEQLATSTHVPAKLAAALRTWNSGPGGRALSQISTEVGIALQAGGLRTYVTMKSACANLEMSVSAAGTSSPIPDAAMQSQYQAALSVLAKAAADCRSAISAQPEGESMSTKEDPAVLHLAQSELSSGIKSVAAITVVINAAVAAA